jgi:hypothetical protein
VARKPYSIHFSRYPRFLSSSQLKCSLENANCPLWKRNNFRSSSKTKAGSFPTGEPRAFVHLIIVSGRRRKTSRGVKYDMFTLERHEVAFSGAAWSL